MLKECKCKDFHVQVFATVVEHVTVNFLYFSAHKLLKSHGTPSEIIQYSLKCQCAKYDALVQKCTKNIISYYTIIRLCDVDDVHVRRTKHRWKKNEAMKQIKYMDFSV